ncbi:MAG: hypothetical protein JWM16_5092 [Verrucomicrobiales bacterium]|nr:hypothetical protein [Verrucomicrobiales bacterium]
MHNAWGAWEAWGAQDAPDPLEAWGAWEGYGRHREKMTNERIPNDEENRAFNTKLIEHEIDPRRIEEHEGKCYIGWDCPP